MIVDRADIERWGQHLNSKDNFPRLISKLISETTRRDTVVHIAVGSETYLSGWDGIVTCQEATHFVPLGVSLWEIGTNGSDVKANSDYKKRTNDSLGFEKKECTFIFVTTTLWQGKDQWANDRKAENVWKNVKVYDSTSITDWLEKSLVSVRWYSKFVKDYPYDSIYTAEESWKMFSIGREGMVITPGLVTSGRETECKMLEAFLTGTKG